MEGLLAYEDTATIIASIYVEQEQRALNAAYRNRVVNVSVV